MSPEERQLLTGLFDRIQGSANVPRDPEAEALIANALKAQPYAPYFLTQAVLVQNQALEAANKKLEDLQAQLNSMQPQGQPQGGGFLSSLGSIFGGGPSAPPEPPRPAQPLPGGPWGRPQQAQPQSYPPQQPPYPPQGAPWGGPPQGGGFLSGALQSAAGVAGGVLLADSIRNLFGGHGGGLGGLGMGTGTTGLGGGGETIVNNYYDDNANGTDNTDIFDTDNNSDDFSSNDDGSFDV